MKNKVLLIDDDPRFTKLLMMNLHLNDKYEVDCVNDARKAVKKAVEFVPDVILLDVIMPHFDGGDVLTLLQNEPVLEHTKVILLTALVAKEETVANMGVTEQVGVIMLSKTVPVASLLQVIDTALDS